MSGKSAPKGCIVLKNFLAEGRLEGSEQKLLNAEYADDADFRGFFTFALSASSAFKKTAKETFCV